MNNAIKMMGLGCTTVALCVAILVVPHQPQIWGPLIAILAGLLGIPVAVGAIRARILGIQFEPIAGGFTWDEWHALASGWSDAVSFGKAERIPKISEVPEEHKAYDFYAILAKEAWYYKFGRALGVLTWVGIIGAFYSLI